ncbi:uncharacterized protein LOC123015787 isoform X2 [Tribolium madens]|uniref:uncharacterized protein LOC123015787 isoform X2 n=1 Tax=Tribolium madens TaxID=41895 RepID=UPI001CF73DCB|nr:uncharacterized protein LOC123015787 isoform X2 [Tribolium madens]
MFAMTKFFRQAYTFPSTPMFSKVAPILLLVLVNSLVNCSALRMKRADIDLQTCIDNFDIHRDKIIRTQDSQKMGAKYLTEIDLGTRGECLRLCCETDDCDVFVFEEKNSGSCYLFHCGPPEDFKCKFTHHANYSSAVLAINRHLPDLESQIKLTKHEQDLSKLRKPESEPEVLPQVSETRPTSSPLPATTPKPKEVFATQVKTRPSEEARKCSRYQFECRSTSECIAIYNACDGIPQCADGSDEAPELGCPDSPTTSQPAPVHLNNPIQPARYDPNIPQQQLHPLLPGLSQQKIYRPQLTQEALAQPQMQAMPQREADFLRPIPNTQNINSRVPFENQQVVQYAPAPVQMQPNWGPHQEQMGPQVPQYADKNSHIFNHKETGLQVPDGQEISQMQYGDQYNPKIGSYYDNYRQPIQQKNWGSGPEEQYQYQQETGNKDWHPESIQNEPPKNAAYKTTSPGHSENKENPIHEQEKMAHELKHSKETTKELKIKIEKHKQAKTEHYPDVVAYKMDGSAEDGVPETASGAVLSLTLGLIITCVMALLIGCRLRVRRRMRKGGKSYAHDADYLVNGMYL